MLLFSFKSWSENNDTIVPLRGSNCELDSTYIKVLISDIKKANIKLIERKHLISINNEQDSIIQFQNLYIKNQEDIIIDFKQKVTTANKINETIEKDLQREKIKTKVFGYGALGLAVVTIITLLIK